MGVRARVLHVVDDYPGPGSGLTPARRPPTFARRVVARQVANLAAHQVARGDVVHVITSDAGDPKVWARTDAAGVRVHRLPRGRGRFARAIDLVRPDIVHLHEGRLAAQALGESRGPTVVTHWGNGGLVLGVDLAPWIAAGQRRGPGEEKNIIFHAGDLTHAVLAALPARGLSGFVVTAVGPQSHAVPGAEIVLGDAPDEVFAALAAEHEIYFSACSLDPHLTGAHAAGMRTLRHGDEHALTAAVESSRPDPGGSGLENHAWESIVAHVDALYAAATSQSSFASSTSV